MIFSFFVQQGRVRALFQEPAVINDQYLVRPRDGRKAVGNHDNRLNPFRKLDITAFLSNLNQKKCEKEIFLLFSRQFFDLYLKVFIFLCEMETISFCR